MKVILLVAFMIVYTSAKPLENFSPDLFYQQQQDDEKTTPIEDLATEAAPKIVPNRKDNPWESRRNALPSYNTFFPIFIGGPGSNRVKSYPEQQSDSGNYYPGNPTAIANSFSTGKGGIASSHATSFGSTDLAVLLKHFAETERKN